MFIGTQGFLIIAILRDASTLILMHLNAARRNAMTSPVSRYTRMLAPVSRCAGPCPDAGAAIAMYFTRSRCRRPYRDTGQRPRCSKIAAGKFTFLLMMPKSEAINWTLVCLRTCDTGSRLKTAHVDLSQCSFALITGKGDHQRCL